MTKKQFAAIKKIAANTGMLRENADNYAGYYDDDKGRHCVVNGHMGIRWDGDVGDVPAAPDCEHINFDRTLKCAFDGCDRVYELPSMDVLKRAYKEMKKESGLRQVKFCPPKPLPCLNLAYLITMLEAMPKTVRVFYEAWNKPVYFADWTDNGRFTMEGIIMPVHDSDKTDWEYGRFDWCPDK